MKRPSASEATKRKKDRLDKGLRAARRGIVHLVAPRSEKQQFTDATREALLKVLNRIEPIPSAKNLDRMVSAAERVVTELAAARKRDDEHSDAAGKARALRKLFSCAIKTRDACDGVFGDKFLRDSLKIPLLRGIIEKWDRTKHSESDIRAVLRYSTSDENFDKFGNNLVVYLDGVIKATSNMAGVMERAARIKDHSDYLYTIGLARHWLKILGVRPKSMNLDKDDEGTTFSPTLFEDFVRALPLDRAIKHETIRTSVAFIRGFSRTRKTR
jgi:hypothetical protein